MVKVPCENCWKNLRPSKIYKKVQNKPYCKDCYNKLYPVKIAESKSYSDKDLKTIYDEKCFIDKKGYYRFKKSRELVHHWVMEEKLGKKLNKNQVVHHLNGNKLDNNLSNLMVFNSQKEHYNWHLDQKRKSGVW